MFIIRMPEPDLEAVTSMLLYVPTHRASVGHHLVEVDAVHDTLPSLSEVLAIKNEHINIEQRVIYIPKARPRPARATSR
jgi:hypothetical protein